MKKIYFLFLTLISTLFYSQVFQTIPIIENGPRDKRIKLVIMGDGFTDSELDVLTQQATNVANYLFSKPPYSMYKNYFNVYLVKVVSPESGVKHPGTATDEQHVNPAVPISNPNTALDVSFDHGGIHRCIYTNDINKVGQVLSTNFPDYDVALVIGNTPYHGGCGGKYPFITMHSDSYDVALHELGHTFGKLHDEYWIANQGEGPNKTNNSDPATVKWKNWIGFRGVGMHPFSENASWFRPHENCEMRYLNRSFCSVCEEALIERIHSILSPIEGYTPNNTTTVSISNQQDFVVNLILPEPNTLTSKWMLNGVEVLSSLDAITIQKNQLQDGNNTLVFNVEDKTPNVRVDGHESSHISTITWNILKNNLGIDEVNSQAIDFVVYPNPTSDVVYLDVKQNIGNKISAEVLDISGRQVINRKKLDKDEKYSLDLGKLPSQTYILKVYNDNTLLFVKKIIKK
nr:M64 family metallopeptidase [Elizabethkingia sp. JS20170427COW]